MALATACCIFSWVVTGGKPLTQVDELFQARHVVLQDSRISAARTHCTDCERGTLGGALLHWTAVQTRATPDELETDKRAKRSPTKSCALGSSGEAAGDERLRLQVSDPLGFTPPLESEMHPKVSSALPAVQPSSHRAVQCSPKPSDAVQSPVQCRGTGTGREQVCWMHASDPLNLTLSGADVSPMH
jgi:hypothetical protein